MTVRELARALAELPEPLQELPVYGGCSTGCYHEVVAVEKVDDYGPAWIALEPSKDDDAIKSR